MKIAILGSGNVGGALGVRWAKAGHEVTFSSRHPDSDQVKKLVSVAGGKAAAAQPRDAACYADAVLLAVPWPAARDALVEAGDLKDRIIIDATNPLRPDLSGLALGADTSAGEQIAAWHPEARVVKAFNTIGANIMADPAFPGGKVFLPYCGNHAEAKRIIHGLAAELGFDPFDAGPISQARVLEPFAMLWISIAFGGTGRDFAFGMLRR